MTLDWQNVLALALVLAAAGYLARRGYRIITARKSAGCGACGNCPADKTPAGQQLVTLDALKPPPQL